MVSAGQEEGREMTRLNELPASMRHVRLSLARESTHPSGDPEDGYDLLVPLDDTGHLDPAEWKKHQAQCRVRRFLRGTADRIGRLRRKPGGQWYFDYAAGDADDEIGFQFGKERFVIGEYVSLKQADEMRTYRVERVQAP